MLFYKDCSNLSNTFCTHCGCVVVNEFCSRWVECVRSGIYRLFCCIMCNGFLKSARFFLSRWLLCRTNYKECSKAIYTYMYYTRWGASYLRPPHFWREWFMILTACSSCHMIRTWSFCEAFVSFQYRRNVLLVTVVTRGTLISPVDFYRSLWSAVISLWGNVLHSGQVVVQTFPLQMRRTTCCCSSE